MADQKVSALTDAGTLDGDEYLYVVDDPAGTPVSRRTTVSAVGGATLARKTADESFSTTSLNNSTGLSFAVSASTDYKFRFVVFFVCANAATGIRLGVNLPTGATVRWGMLTPVANPQGTGNAIMTGSSDGVDAAFSTTNGSDAAQMAFFEGIASIGGTAGTLQLRHGSETANSTTILADSFGELTEIA